MDARQEIEWLEDILYQALKMIVDALRRRKDARKTVQKVNIQDADILV